MLLLVSLILVAWFVSSIPLGVLVGKWMRAHAPRY